jgi:hypothetical protein
MYEADADITPRNSPPMSPVHQHTSYSPPPPFYSSSDDEDDNNSTYLFPEIATGRRSRGVSGSSTVRFFSLAGLYLPKCEENA